MKFQYNLLPEKLNINHTYDNFLVPNNFPEIKKIGPVKVYGFLKKGYEEVKTQLDIECNLIVIDIINKEEFETKLEFELDLLFSNNLSKADYSLEELKDFDDLILGNILLELPYNLQNKERGNI